MTRFLVSSDLNGAFNPSRRDGSLPVVEQVSLSDTLDPPVALVPGSHEDDAIGQHMHTRTRYARAAAGHETKHAVHRRHHPCHGEYYARDMFVYARVMLSSRTTIVLNFMLA